MIKLANRFDRFMPSSPVLSLIRVVEQQRGSLSQEVGKPQNQKPDRQGGCIGFE
jgi:predicted component of type VI protein secretion system